ncbi:hypothetical protein ACHMW5_08915 [Azospirillum melinis]|uniref:hypothetical protein n=1 Tax=Azospirillum melinis TaxID=328839 RepID=UPI003756B185
MGIRGSRGAGRIDRTRRPPQPVSMVSVVKGGRTGSPSTHGVIGPTALATPSAFPSIVQETRRKRGPSARHWAGTIDTEFGRTAMTVMDGIPAASMGLKVEIG